MKSAFNLRRTVKLVYVALLALTPLLVQAAGPVLPDAGSLLQQAQPSLPPTPSPSGVDLTIAPQGNAKLPMSAPFLVKSLQIVGNTLFDTATLHGLVADAEGTSITLSRLGELAARITDYYHGHGYPLARAFIPAQTIKSGVVRIEIMEARYGKVSVDNSSRVNEPLLAATLSSLQSGQAIEQTGLEHALLLLSDIPGIEAAATLKPGDTVGTSDLLVNATPASAVIGQVALDNYGNRYTGRERIGGTVSFIDPLHHGDVLSLNGLSSGRGMDYGRIAYESLLNGLGTRLGGAYSSMHYALGGPLSSLDAHGDVQVESLWVKHPLMRSRDSNLYAQVQYDRLQLRDEIDAGDIHTDRHLDSWTLIVTGDMRDAFLSGAINSWNVGWTEGRTGFDDTAAQLADADSAKTRGSFSKWNASLARLQSLGPNNGLFLALSGQWADTNLDSSQKMTAGGPYTVRAYDSGAVSGDTGILGTLELRHSLGPVWGGQSQATAFVDSAHVTLNKNTWSGVTGANSATLSGAGLGLNWAGPSLWSARAYVAAPIGSTPSVVASTSSTRGGVEITRGF